MKVHITKLVFRGFAAALALAAPGMASASDHILIVKTTGNVSVSAQNGIANSDGTITTPVIVNTTGVVNITFGGGTQSVRPVLVNVKMCKPGTKGNFEWLDQGSTIVGANGTLTSGLTSTVPTSGYRLVLTTTITNQTNPSGPCDSLGAVNYTRTLEAVIAQRSGASGTYITKFTGIFSFGNVLGNGTGGVPEPGTLSLMGLGLVGLGWMGARRARKARASAA